METLLQQRMSSGFSRRLCAGFDKVHVTGLTKLTKYFQVHGFEEQSYDPRQTESTEPLTLGLYVNDFVYCSVDNETETMFNTCCLVSSKQIHGSR